MQPSYLLALKGRPSFKLAGVEMFGQPIEIKNWPGRIAERTKIVSIGGTMGGVFSKT